MGSYYIASIPGMPADLTSTLTQRWQNFTTISHIVKSGKTLRYPVGTVATLSHGRRHYFCIGYSEMDAHNVELSRQFVDFPR